MAAARLHPSTHTRVLLLGRGRCARRYEGSRSLTAPARTRRCCSRRCCGSTSTRRAGPGDPAHGAAQPSRFWFDAKDGTLYIGDVGQDLWEYVFAVSGTDGVRRNFGWNIVEGNHCYNARTLRSHRLHAAHRRVLARRGLLVTGGVTYRGKALPMLDGRYFYARLLHRPPAQLRVDARSVVADSARLDPRALD